MAAEQDRSRWFVAVVVVNFDEAHGQLVKCLYPIDSV